MKNISRDYPFGDVSAPWGDTIMSSLLSILHQNDHICINLSHEKNAKDSPFWYRADPWSDTIMS